MNEDEKQLINMQLNQGKGIVIGGLTGAVLGGTGGSVSGYNSIAKNIKNPKLRILAALLGGSAMGIGGAIGGGVAGGLAGRGLGSLLGKLENME